LKNEIKLKNTPQPTRPNRPNRTSLSSTLASYLIPTTLSAPPPHAPSSTRASARASASTPMPPSHRLSALSLSPRTPPSPPLAPRALSQSVAPAPVPSSGVGLLPTSATPACSYKHPQPQLLPSRWEHSHWSHWWTFGASPVALRCAGVDVCFGVLRVVLILIATSGALIIKQSFGKVTRIPTRVRLPNLFHNGTRWAGRRTKAGRCAIERKGEVHGDGRRRNFVWTKT
jgi:hypothetical protein